MKAAVLTEINEPLQILALDQEAPKTMEARVAVKATGICMSDWHIMNGDWPTRLPLVPGHEAAGIVEELGPGPSHLSLGDHVIFSFHPHCGHCSYCNSGRSVLCNGHSDTAAHAQHDGTTRLSLRGEPVGQMARVGTFSEKVVCAREHLVPIRKDVPWPIAALIGCSVATGIGSVIRHAKVNPGATVLVVGCGGVGLNIVQGARISGAGAILAVDILEEKLDYARRFGATHTINATTADVVKTVRHLTGTGVDYSFDAIGSESTTKQIVDCLRPGGRAVMVGIPAASVKAGISPFSMVFQEKTLSGSFYGSVQPDRDFPFFADLYMDRRIDLDSLVSRRYRLEEINEAFVQLRNGNAARGVVVFD